VISIKEGPGCAPQQLPQPILARHKRLPSQVVAIKIEKVEGIKRQLTALLFGELTAQRVEISDARLVLDDRFPIQHGVACRQGFGGAGDREELSRPVMTPPRIDDGFTGAQMDLGAIAIGLDFVDPGVSGRRTVAIGRVAGFDEPGKGHCCGSSGALGGMKGWGQRAASGHGSQASARPSSSTKWGISVMLRPPRSAHSTRSLRVALKLKLAGAGA